MARKPKQQPETVGDKTPADKAETKAPVVIQHGRGITSIDN